MSEEVNTSITIVENVCSKSISYQVYVEIGGEIVPFVAVNSATGDYHG